MPRSGTTLVEQILSSHPKVFAGDELNFLPEIILRFSEINTEKRGNVIAEIISAEKLSV